MNNPEELWSSILESIKEEIPEQSFETWIKPIKPISLINDEFNLQVPNVFFKEWITQHYKNKIEESLSKVTNSSGVKLIFTINSDAEYIDLSSSSQERKTIYSEEEEQIHEDYFMVNPKYTFSEFVEYPANRFALGASKAVAESPGKSYNPLFIYGDVGLGKTHLLHAIGTYIKKNNPSAVIVYVTSEKFMNEMISAIRLARMLEFREKYRTVDVLLIDDIQFLEGKEATKEEFFHTFNALYESNKQIVTTSDSNPKNLNLEERLRSRFEMGLVADIGKPELEGRIAILRKKAESEKIAVTQDVLIFIANTFVDNIRELEGALIKVCAYASLTNSNITIDIAKEELKDLIMQGKKVEETITIDKIKQVVVKYFGLKSQDMIIKKRTRKLVLPRQIAMYLARELTENSLPEIGENFGKRDHTTVIYAYETIKNKIETDKNISSQINEIISIIKE